MCVVVTMRATSACSGFGPDRTEPNRRSRHFNLFINSESATTLKICPPSSSIDSLVLHGASLALVMKNIAISGTWRFAIPGNNITTAIVDVDRACLWIASERLNADADIEIDIYKMGLPDDSYEMEDVSAFTQGPHVMNWSRKTMQIYCDCR